MTKIKKWKSTVAAMLAVLCAVTFGLALHFGTRSTAAADECVFAENTAEYTIDTSRRSTWTGEYGTEYYFPWVYDEATNTWSNGSAGFDSSNIPSISGSGYCGIYENFFLYVTKSGKIAFDLVAVKIGTGVCGSLYKYTTSIDADGENIFERWSSEEFSETERIELDVTEGQTVRLWIYTESANTNNSFQIKGLKRPQAGSLNQQISFTANASEHGTVAYGGQSGKTVSGSFAYKETTTVRAIPEEGYIFSHWEDQYGAILPDGEELTPRKWNETYTAEFIQEGATYDLAKWEYTEDGDTYTSKTSKQKEQVILSVGFYGNAVIFFDYLLPVKGSINVILDGKYRYNNTYGVWYDSDAGSGDEWKPYAYQVEEEKERTHKLEIRFVMTDNSIAQIKIRNLKIERNPESTTMSVKYNEKLADVYVFPMIEYRNLSGDQSTGVNIRDKNSPYIIEANRLGSEQQKAVVVGLRYAVVGIRKASVTSSILPEQSTTVALTSLSTEQGEEIKKANSDILFHCFEEPRNGDAISATFAEGKIDYLTTNTSARGSVNGSVIQMNFEEVAPMPEVSAMVTAAGSTEPEKVLQNGDTLYLPFGEANSVNIVLSDYSVTEDYVSKSTYDGQTLQDLKIGLHSDIGKLYFTLPANIQENKDLVISYGCEGYADSDPFIVHIRIRPEGTMGENLHYFGDITVEDGGSYSSGTAGTSAWEFAPDRYDEQLEGRYAYRASNYSNEGAASYRYVSNLKLTVTGGGTLYFEIKMSGYGGKNTWLLYSFEKQIDKSPTNSGANAASGGGKALLYTANTGDNQVTVADGLEGVSLDPIGNGWYSVRVSLEVLFGGAVPEESETVLYLAYGAVNSNGLNGEFVIRNIGYSQTESHITYGVKGEETAGGTLTVTAGSDPYVSGEEIVDGSRLNFSFKKNDNYEFYAWVDGNANILSFNAEYTHFVDGDIAVYAVVAHEGTYKLRIRGNFYETLNAALTASAAGDDIILIRDYKLEQKEAGESVTIKSGVNLIVPIDNEGTYYVEGGSVDRVVWETEKNYEYRKRVFTVDAGVTLTVNGAIYIGGTLHRPNHSAQAHTSGNYAELVLNGNIIVAKGGKFDTNGRVTGAGGITVQNGGSIYQPFLILDFSGGTNTSGLFTLYQTPFSRYAMVNIQCTGGYTIEYGGVLYGHASLYALSTYTTIDQPFISYIGQNASGEQGIMSLINLKKDAKAHIVYNNSHAKIPDEQSLNNTVDIGQTTITITGGATAGFMTFPFGITTKDVHFSIPYNYSLILQADENGKNGEYEVLYDYKLMPGASIWVKSSATLTLNADLLVYDGFINSVMSSKTYPKADKLRDAGYSTTANLIVDGKLVIGKRNAEAGEKTTPPVTFLGVVQSKQTGATIEIDKTAVLKGKIVDGGLTSYDCNYAEFESTARVWDQAHQVLALLEAGHTYTSVALDTWTLPSITIRYARNCEEGEAADPDFPAIAGDLLSAGRGGHVYAEYSTLTVPNMSGSWKIDHAEHCYDWTQLSEKEKNLNGEKYKDLFRQCTEIGCTEIEHKLLLEDEEFSLSATYKGSAFSMEDLRDIFYQHYFGSAEKAAEYAQYFHAEVNGDTANQNAATYDKKYTVTLTGGFFGEKADTTSKTFDFTVDRFDVSTLDKSKIEAALEAKNFTYDGNAKQLTAQELEAALKEAFGSDVAHSAKWADNTDAGTDTASVTITGTGDNFTGTLTVNFSIAKAKLTVNVVGKNKPYDGSAWENVGNAKVTTDFTVADGTIYKSDDIGLTLTVGSASAGVGEYTVTGTASNSNYDVTVTSGTHKITRAELTVNIESKEHTYGETPAQLSYTLGGVQNEEENAIKALITLQSTGATQWAAATKYDITAWYKGSEIDSPLEAENDDVLKNYTVTVSGGTGAYTVEKKDIGGATFSVHTAYTYDNTQKQPGVNDITVTLDGYTDDHKVTFTVGNYQNNINATTDGASLTVTATGNFTGTKEVKFTIAKATVTAMEITNKDSLAYNGNVLEPVVVVKAGSLTLGEEDFTVTYKHNTKEETEVKNAGAYTVTVELTDECKNYQLGDVTTATFTVAKAEITVKPEDKHTPEGKDLDPLTWAVTETKKGAYFSDDKTLLDGYFALTTTATKDQKGDYDITITWKNDARPDNYDVTFGGNGKYHVEDSVWANVSVTGTGKIKYDGTAHELTVTVNNAELDGKTTITQTFGDEQSEFTGATNVGTYEVTVTIAAQGYTSFTGKYTIEITAREVTVTFDEASSVYGDEVKTSFTYQMSGDTVLGGDDAGFKAAIAAANPYTTATNKSGVNGSYKITTRTKPELANYTVTVKDGKYTITPAALEVTIQSSGHVYGAAEKGSLTYSLSGVKNDDESEIKSAITLSTEAEQWSNVGNYAITANYNAGTGILANYTVNVTNATNTLYEVTKKGIADVATMSATGTTYNGQTQEAALTVTFEGYLDHFKKDTDYTVSYDKDEVKNAGTYTVTVTAKEEGNYSGSITCKFVIDKATITEVKVTSGELTYDGTDQTDKVILEVKAGSLTLGKGDYTVTFAKGEETEVKNAGTYTVTIAPAANGNYKLGNVSTATAKVNQKQITVKANDITAIYGEEVQEFTYTATGLAKDEKAEDVLTVNLEADRTIEGVGTYTITGTGTAANYKFTVESGSYTVKEREITVKINDQTFLYDGTEPDVPQEQNKGWTVTSGNIIDGDNLFIVLTKEKGVAAGGYAISGTFTNVNYKVTFEGTKGKDGTFTIQKRAITVGIIAQHETYDAEKAQKKNGKAYKFDGGQWSIVPSQGDGLASGETSDMLHITLRIEGTPTDAGSYDIAGTWENGNYAVTFTGGTGAYTIAQRDISTEGDFFIMAGGTASVSDRLSVNFAGEPIELTGYVLLGDEPLDVTLVLSADKITEMGEFTLTVTVNDKNYCGSKTFRVVVKNEDGYTERLVETLDSLAELAEGMTAQTLTAEDFDALKQMAALIAALDSDEKEQGATALARYEELISAWNEAVEGLDGKIETAQSIGDALLGGLIGVTATVSALAAVAFVLSKGGLL